MEYIDNKEFKEIIDAAYTRVKDIASDIRTKSAEEITKCYTVTRIGENKDILSIKIDECVNREYRLYFDIKRQPDNTYAILGDVEIQIYAQYMGVFDKDMNYIPPEEE